MNDKAFPIVTLEKYLETVNRHCSTEERKEIFRQMGQYLLEGVIDDIH